MFVLSGAPLGVEDARFVRAFSVPMVRSTSSQCRLWPVVGKSVGRRLCMYALSRLGTMDELDPNEVGVVHAAWHARPRVAKAARQALVKL